MTGPLVVGELRPLVVGKVSLLEADTDVLIVGAVLDVDAPGVVVGVAGFTVSVTVVIIVVVIYVFVMYVVGAF